MAEIRTGTVFFFPGRAAGAPVYECVRWCRVRGLYRRVWPDAHIDTARLTFPLETQIVILK